MIGYNDSKGRINYICFMPTALMIGLFFANISSGFEAIGVSQQIVSALSKLFIAFAFLLCIPLLRGRKTNIIIAIFMASSITICLNYLYYSFTNNNNAYLTNTTMTYVTQCLPALLIVSNIYRNEHEIMLIYLKKSSMIISCISFLLMIMNIMGSNLFRIKGYSMGLGYALILPCIILLYDYSEKDSYLSFFLSLSDLLFIVLFGSRGAVLGIVFYYIYFVLIKNLVQQKHTVRTIAVTIFSLVIVLSIKEILQVVYEWLTKNGYYSRTIYLLLFDIYHDSHRNEIYARLISAIEEHPFTFRGISSDYLLVDTYSHNIFIEIIYEFGLLLAIPIIILLLYLIIKSLSFSTNNKMLSIYLCSSIPGLLVSGSLWLNSNFWIWIALCVCEIYSGENNEEENNSRYAIEHNSNSNTDSGSSTHNIAVVGEKDAL